LNEDETYRDKKERKENRPLFFITALQELAARQQAIQKQSIETVSNNFNRLKN
jgi:hypothetical protein